MTGLDYFSWIVLIVIVLTVVAGVVALARLPGQIAASNGHPNAAAINVAGWLGIITGVFWILALIWANMRPVNPSGKSLTDSVSTKHIDELEARIAALESAAAGDDR